MSHYGERFLGETFYMSFNTQTTAGVPITLAGTPVVTIYRQDDTGTEQTTGLTLTVDLDSKTGFHNVKVVTTASSFYTSGTDFHVLVTTGTVNGQSIAGFVVGQFKLSGTAGDGAIAIGTAQSISASTITLASGSNGLGTVGSILVGLCEGTDAKGKSRTATYSGASDIWTVDPAWNTSGESTPSGTIKYRCYFLPPAPASALSATERSAIATALLDLTDGVESGLTLRNMMRDLAAVVIGEATSQSGAAPVFKSVDISGGTVQSTKSRVTGASVDSAGNRGKPVLDNS